jgi:hypothetical protein
VTRGERSPRVAEHRVGTVPAMPHASDYREAAARYMQLGEDLRRQAAVLSGWVVEGQLGSGPAAGAVAERLAWAAGDLNGAGEEMARLSRECQWRADVCEAYRQAVRAWWAAPDVARGRPPGQPYAWVPRL